MKLLRKIVNNILPFHYKYNHNDDLFLLVKKINLYFAFFPSKKKNYINEINFINHKAKKEAPISYIFPYPFVFEYDNKHIDVYKDANNELFYVIHKGNRLYYHKGFKTEQMVIDHYLSILIEQDEKSPHRYRSSKFDVVENDVVVDIGAAEGNFSLEIVEKVRALYIFETDSKWIEALHATFKPWKEKVYIINKYVSSIDNDTCVTVNTFFKDIPVNFIKIDVEGAELSILKNSMHVLHANKLLKLAICTYHKQSHEKKIRSLLRRWNYNLIAQNGYMLFLLDRLSPPYFRKGLIKAVTSSTNEIV